jgi:hypothetical protein
MAIFPLLNLEDVIQVGDKTRLDASKSFISKDEAAVTLVEIEPEAGSGFVTVGNPGSSKDWYLDWLYQGATRTVTVTVRITTDASPVTFSKTLKVNSVADDMLLSSDQDLLYYEHDVLRYIKDGKSSFLNFHRAARDKILDYLNTAGFVDVNGNKITKDMLNVDSSEVREWSICQTLALIYFSVSNGVGDVFSLKSESYESRVKEARGKAILRLDLNSNDEIDDGEFIRLKSVPIFRR